ncbi:MAG: IS200/IS605 family transposase [Phycisphaerae bacterium]|jgi:REP element-mobilizing transposase RayT
MPHSYFNCLIHYVFSTKNRRKAISAEIRERLWAYIGGIARENGMKALAVGGMEDHVHLLVTLPATLSVAKAAQLIKGGSSKWVHETFPAMKEFAWQEGYGAFSIGTSGAEDTIAYIVRQEEHHRTRSFEDEFVAFLNRHGIDYDPRYVFG